MSEDIEARDINLIFMGKMIEKYFGEEALDKLIEHKYEKIRDKWEKLSEEGGGKLDYLLRLFTNEVHEYEIIKNTPECLEIKVYDCLHARVFKSYNAADLGEKMICSGDFAVIEGYNSSIKLERPQIAMNSDVCHFKFKLKD